MKKEFILNDEIIKRLEKLKELYVSPITAEKLHEIGFREECSAEYDGHEIQFKWKNYGNMSVHSLRNLQIPTKSQVFRWFREKYNNHSFIELVYHEGVKFDYVIYVDESEDECLNYGDGPFEIYEEAEDACIDKLIELAKQQDK